MMIRVMLGAAVGLGIVGGAAVVAKQQGPPRVAAPVPAEEPSPPRISDEVEALSPPAMPPEVVGLEPLVGFSDPDEVLPPLPGTRPPRIVAAGVEASATVIDSETFIDEGRATAEGVIEALTDERKTLEARLRRIDDELARWEAIKEGLTTAKEMTPQVPSARINPSPDDSLDLEPLPEPGQ
ncbi:hypothetical protein [Tautonia marina]|uniref:hypothetical protein n=1 Tax=Tautonia marina TaxID=2653855 RepID=UPI0012606E7A|nr:hypothetical protein [Tautonia marina]